MAQSGSTVETEEEPIESPWLEKVEVEGFQGSRNFSLVLSSHANFLIGKNGCGKTTLINLINAGLACDVAGLLRARFSRLTLQLTFGTLNSRYSLVYEKAKVEDSPLQHIDFKVLGPRGGPLYEQNLYDQDRPPYRSAAGRYYYEGQGFDADFVFSRAGRTRPNTTWLSILRSDSSSPPSADQATLTPIDRKLNELTVRTSRYLSALDSRANGRSGTFQKEYFLSLLGNKGSDAWGAAELEFSGLDLDIEEANLGKIFSHLKLGIHDYKYRLQSHFKCARAVVPSTNNTITVQDALTIADTVRIHQLNEKWLAFEKDRASIYSPRSEFVDIVNDLFINKKLSFTERNQPVFVISPTRTLRPIDLSSGEKQVYIILSEALVQEGKRAIYLADEPELSLHVEWQQYLVENIFRLNDRCQVLFATHSPDILGPYSENAIDVESL